MKKIYVMPKETVGELGLEGCLLDVSGNAPTKEDGGLDGSGDESDGEDMSVKAQRNMWDNQW